jgi:hypothetical protein
MPDSVTTYRPQPGEELADTIARARQDAHDAGHTITHDEPTSYGHDLITERRDARVFVIIERAPPPPPEPEPYRADDFNPDDWEDILTATVYGDRDIAEYL